MLITYNMERVDVAIQSYKKPESLIYTLLSLKKYCGEHIGTIYINDDKSGNDVVKYYHDKQFLEKMFPIKILVRVNKYHFPPAYVVHPLPKYLIPLSVSELITLLKCIKHMKFPTENDIRYQWAINKTTASKLLIIHDDVKFNADIIEKYFECFEKNKNLIVAGELGQCWICSHSKEGCTPKKIMQGVYPSKVWPQTVPKDQSDSKFACRINEWCCMIDVEKSKKINAYFGNYYKNADIAAYWFCKAIQAGYDFIDPLPDDKKRAQYYEHCWQGYPGNAVWDSKGNHNGTYQNNMIKDALLKEFYYEIK